MDKLFGCLIVCAITFGIASTLFNYFSENPRVLVGLVTFGLIIGMIVKFAKSNQAAQQKEDQERRDAKQKYENLTYERESAVKQLAEIDRQTSSIVLSFPALLKQAGQSLSEAEEEYNDRVFIPFWEAIVRSTQCLDRYHKGIFKLAENSKLHRNLLQQINRVVQDQQALLKTGHLLDKEKPASLDLTSLALVIPAIADPTDIVQKMQSLVREAHKNPDFANAYGHMKTHKGLENIGSEIRSMRTILFDSIQALHDSVTESLSSIDSRQDVDNFSIKHMLDNIQRGRKPED